MTENEVLEQLAVILNRDVFTQVLEWRQNSDKLKALNLADENEAADEPVDIYKVWDAQIMLCQAIAEDIAINNGSPESIAYVKRYYPKVSVTEIKGFNPSIKEYTVAYGDVSCMLTLDCTLLVKSMDGRWIAKTSIKWNNATKSIMKRTTQLRGCTQIKEKYTKANEQPIKYVTFADSYKEWLDNGQ